MPATLPSLRPPSAAAEGRLKRMARLHNRFCSSRNTSTLAPASLARQRTTPVARSDKAPPRGSRHQGRLRPAAKSSTPAAASWAAASWAAVSWAAVSWAAAASATTGLLPSARGHHRRAAVSWAAAASATTGLQPPARGRHRRPNRHHRPTSRHSRQPRRRRRRTRRSWPTSWAQRCPMGVPGDLQAPRFAHLHAPRSADL